MNLVPLADRYEAFLLDLDGVLYRGDEPIPGAAEAVAGLRERGRRVLFLTNNSARTPERVAGRLSRMGVPAQTDDVVTSAEAAASMIAAEVPGASAFVVGEGGVVVALESRGLRVVQPGTARVDVVVVGWDRSMDYDKLREASVLVQRGARLVATNTDASYPAPGGELWPGAGALVAAIETATGRQAESAGKPGPALFEVALERAGTRNAMVVGDRIETDIAGAAGAGLDSAMVLTGAAGRADLLDGDALPSAVLPDVGGLLRPAALVPLRDREEADDVERLVKEAGLLPEAADGETVVAGDGEAVATASASVRNGEAYVYSVAVREEARGLDLGTLVVAGAWRRAAGLGAGRGYLLTEDAAGFFARLGFEPTDREALPEWIRERTTACSTSAVAMRRDVSS